MLGLFKSRPLLDEETAHWMFDVYGWALHNFDAGVFYDETILVTPSNTHFPGRENSAQGMAELIFEKVKEYAGLGHWPCRLVNEEALTTIEPPRVVIEGALRGSKGIVPTSVDESNKLLITYHPFQLNDPEVLIASYAHMLAHYLGTMAQEPPPGDETLWPAVTEVLAVFLGFGVIMANSANTARIRSCGSCCGPAVERTNYLSQDDTTYALAIFCALKKIPAKAVTPYLKKTLHPYFKKAMKEIENQKTRLELITPQAALPAIRPKANA